MTVNRESRLRRYRDVIESDGRLAAVCLKVATSVSEWMIVHSLTLVATVRSRLSRSAITSHHTQRIGPTGIRVDTAWNWVHPRNRSWTQRAMS